MNTIHSMQDIENILNAILVNEGVRSAMLIQPADYETTAQYNKIVKNIKRLFPELVLSVDYEDYQGTIISKQSYDGEDISLNRMGEILGYPCYNGYETLNRDEPLFKLELKVSYFYMNQLRDEISLVTNICKDKDKTVEQFKLLSENALVGLHSDSSHKLLKRLGIDIQLVYVNIENIISTQHIINKLITNKGLSKEEKDNIINVLSNMLFGDKLSEYGFQFDNPIHKGILLGLLLKDKYNVLSPFYPLTNNETQQVVSIILKLEKALLNILDKTNTTKTEKTTNLFNNMGGFIDKNKILKYGFQYNNPVHTGILLGLLLTDKYDALSLFKPLKERFPDQHQEVEEITIELENAFIDILYKTKIKTTSRRARSVSVDNTTISKTTRRTRRSL